jgi:hypothetical protein
MVRVIQSILLIGVLPMAGCFPMGGQHKPLSPRPTGLIKEGIHDGNRALEIDGEDADGQSFKLSDYRGKVVLLDFWAGW